MCGIAGLVDLAGRPIDAALLGRMTDVLAHRGPDGSGLLLAQPAGEGFESTLLRTLAGSDDAARTAVVGLGSRRLAIIDTSERGLQPMVDRTGSVALVFNGELYNFRELRAELEVRGCTFESGTDTEVFLAAYLVWGDASLDRAKGMYGFALWDGRAGRLLLGRDRFGIKPLYYARVGDRVAFASEIKALLEAPWLPRIAHDDAVAEFLLHGNCDFAERTLFRDVQALPPGHKLVVDLRRRDLAVSPYYALRLGAGSNSNGAQPDAGKLEQLRDLLEGSVREHLVSDVPVGSCLSGGVDSSSVVGLIGKLLREQPEAATALGGRIHTFTSSYDDDPSVDERQYALPMAASVGAESHLVFPTAQDFVEQFPRMTYHFDMPFGTLSFYAQWCVMRAAKEAGMTVMLDGQGGDEVFGGYGKFRYGYLASLLRAGRVTTLAREAAGMVRQGDRYLLDLRNGYRYLPAWVRRRLGVDSLLARSLRPGLGAASAATSNPATRWWANARGARNGSNGLTVVQRLQMDDITLDTLPQLLRYEDRSSMAFSIEARVPFLDHEVVEFGLSLPDHLKISGGWSKYALRQSLRGVLPDLVRTRTTKLGFAAPDQRWLSSDLRPFAMELLSGELRSDRYVDGTALRLDYEATARRKTPTEAYLGLFRVLSLEMWMRTFKVSCA